jgi:signal transduction histidine kinase
MASLGKLSASVVHEINNPIAGIQNLVLLIKRIAGEETLDAATMEQFRGYLDLMETETRRISRIASNLLAFAHQEKRKRRPVDLHRLIEKTLIINQNLLKLNKIRVETRLADGLPDAFGSEDQLQQVFMNIVSNAAESMEASPVRVLTIETAAIPEEGRVRVVFRDTGVGVDEAEFSRLFEPFFTTKKKGKGVGLGLSLAYGIIQEHGGTIDVKSKVGKGAAFFIDLPTGANADERIADPDR